MDKLQVMQGLFIVTSIMLLFSVYTIYIQRKRIAALSIIKTQCELLFSDAYIKKRDPIIREIVECMIAAAQKNETIDWISDVITRPLKEKLNIEEVIWINGKYSESFLCLCSSIITSYGAESRIAEIVLNIEKVFAKTFQIEMYTIAHCNVVHFCAALDESIATLSIIASKMKKVCV